MVDSRKSVHEQILTSRVIFSLKTQIYLTTFFEPPRRLWQNWGFFNIFLEKKSLCEYSSSYECY